MRLLTFLIRAVFAAFTVLAAVTGVQSAPANGPLPEGQKKARLKTALATVVAILALQAAGAVVFVYSGFYNIAANEPHAVVVRQTLKQTARESVQQRADDIQSPPLRRPELVRRGLVLYGENCLVCHGAPGVAPEQIGRGINPTPPPLMTAGAHWTDAELYWITTHGLKMTGMPAFGVKLSETDTWGVVAFLREMAWLSPAEYRQWVTAVEEEADARNVDWVKRDDEGLARLASRGDSERGRTLLEKFGCGTCHVIPGVGRGKVGPPLMAFVERQYIAGAVVNSPENLAAWIVDPKQIEPKTAMPSLDVEPAEALDIVAYLYTLGKTQRFQRLREWLEH